MAEGSEQSTDRHFAEYCYRSTGSAREVRNQLIVAVQRSHITEAERLPLDKRYEEIGKMLAGLIGYLEQEDLKRRTRPPKSKKRPPDPPNNL